MDEDALRASLMGNHGSLSPESSQYPPDEIKPYLLNEAREIREKFPDVQDPEERERLKKRYEQIDRELGMIKREEYRIRVEKDFDTREARKKTKGELEREADLEKVEKGRKHLAEKQQAGARDAAFNRIKSELNYLLNNYKPQNDHKIEQLIDKWRRSGDPAYDPGIRTRFRNAKKKKAQSDYAL